MTNLTEATIFSLQLLTSDLTGLPSGNIPQPEFRITKLEEISKLVGPNSVRNLIATYDHYLNRILIAEEALKEIDPLKIESYYIHEYVHYLQYSNNFYSKVSCIALLEGLAYTTQRAFLELKGIPHKEIPTYLDWGLEQMYYIHGSEDDLCGSSSQTKWTPTWKKSLG